MNKVLLLGHLGAEPDLRHTGAGHPVLHFSMATTETYLDKNKEKQERTEWHRITLWGKRAEGLSRLLTKGSRVLVEGRLETSSYEKEGTKRYTIDIVANDLWFAGGPGRPATFNGAFSRAPALPPDDAGGLSDLPF